MLEAKVLGITRLGDSGFPAVLLRHAERVLFISIGPPEAGAIQLALVGEKTPRLMTHDLVCNILAGLSGRVESVAIYKLEEQTFFGYLNVEQLDEEGALLQGLRIDARPSDAIAIALRVGCPIYISEEVMKEAGHDVDLLGPMFSGEDDDDNDTEEDEEDEEDDEEERDDDFEF